MAAYNVQKIMKENKGLTVIFPTPAVMTSCVDLLYTALNKQ